MKRRGATSLPNRPAVRPPNRSEPGLDTGEEGGGGEREDQRLDKDADRPNRAQALISP